jgi:hypothetical protein
MQYWVEWTSIKNVKKRRGEIVVREKTGKEDI